MRYLIATALVVAFEGDPSLLWKTSVGCHHVAPGVPTPGCWVPGFSGTDSSPAFNANRSSVVIGSYDGNVYSLDVKTGAQLWKTSLGMAVGEGTPALIKSMNCFAVATLQSVYCLDAVTGEKTWSWSPSNKAQVASLGAVDQARGLIFAGTLDKNLYGLDVKDGTTKWWLKRSGEIWATHGPLLVGDDLVCTGVGGNAIPTQNCTASMDCVNRTNGELVWSKRTGIQIQSTASVSDATNTLYIGDYDGCMYAFGVKDGTRKWRTCTKGRLESSSAVANEGPDEVVLIGSADGHVYAFQGDYGSIAWSTKLGDALGPLQLSGGVASSPHVSSDGVAYVGGPEDIFGLNATTGEVLWKVHVGDMVGSSPLVREDAPAVLYIGSEDGYLRALKL